ncbi:MAG TPA: Crp/Fnr family transcriptional regulator [Candidatus Acidoferrum sp.]|jgi:CRP-like cAMP-binding protein|nr:Crp/Fnr family transcriptional regulator [Candidatus Acidoferrum sp.]
MNATDAPFRNRILRALPPMERDTLLAQLRPTTLSAKTVIFEPGEAIDSVHFPLDGVISMLIPLSDGIVEVASIGNEGIVGVPLMPAGVGHVRAVSPLGAQTLQMRAATFLAEIERLDTFRRLVERYLLALFAQISQAAACNRLHTNEQRLSRWLLMTQDRVGRDTFSVTQDVLAQMLGSRRGTVTLSAQLLQASGLIAYHRGRVTVVDRKGLESACCECYAALRKELGQVVHSA